MTYDEWIAAFREEYGDGECLCWWACEDLQRAFPELERYYGAVVILVEEEHVEHDHHVWCVAPGGRVLDPTETQYEGEIIERKIFVAEPEFRRTNCAACGTHSYDLEPLPPGHMFESLRSEKVGDWVNDHAGRRVAHHCP